MSKINNNLSNLLKKLSNSMQANTKAKNQEQEKSVSTSKDINVKTNNKDLYGGLISIGNSSSKDKKSDNTAKQNVSSSAKLNLNELLKNYSSKIKKVTPTDIKRYNAQESTIVSQSVNNDSKNIEKQINNSYDSDGNLIQNQEFWSAEKQDNNYEYKTDNTSAYNKTQQLISFYQTSSIVYSKKEEYNPINKYDNYGNFIASEYISYSNYYRRYDQNGNLIQDQEFWSAENQNQ